jgi:hypothetical protein
MLLTPGDAEGESRRGQSSPEEWYIVPIFGYARGYTSRRVNACAPVAPVKVGRLAAPPLAELP